LNVAAEEFLEVYKSEERRLIAWTFAQNQLWNYKARVDLPVTTFSGNQQVRVNGLLDGRGCEGADGLVFSRLVEASGGGAANCTRVNRNGADGIGRDVGYRYSWPRKIDVTTRGLNKAVKFGDIVVTGLLDTTALRSGGGQHEYISEKRDSLGELGGTEGGKVGLDSAPRVTTARALVILLSCQAVVALLSLLRVIRCGKYLDLGVINELCGGSCRPKQDPRLEDAAVFSALITTSSPLSVSRKVSDRSTAMISRKAPIFVITQFVVFASVCAAAAVASVAVKASQMRERAICCQDGIGSS
jgi:hypothetical protein